MSVNSFIPTFLDPYDRAARLYPGLLAVLAPTTLLVCVFGDVSTFSTLLSVLGFYGAAYVLGRIARNAGKRIQPTLFSKWGGAPTIQLLRHRDHHFDVHTKARFHEILSSGLKKKLPTVDFENADHKAADELYRAANTWLIGQTRDIKKFPLVFKENIAFGFHRNVLGLRPFGIVISATCFLWAMIKFQIITALPPYFSYETMQQLKPASAIAISVSLIMAGIWIFLVTEAAAKRAAFAYAERLLQACDQLPLNLPTNQ